MAAAPQAQNTPPTDAPNGQPPTQNASLYCGDLPENITEAVLFDLFKTVGPVLSIRVCRDSVTRRSLGYAYVNFQNPADAERALDSLNYNVVQGKPIRIMWCHRDPSLRKSSNGNVFIKNLHKDIDNQTLFDTFSQFGNILSCKVALDGSGQSLGHGFVHFESESAAVAATEKVNGMLLKDQKVFVGPFLRRNQRQQESETTFTNVYVRNFKGSTTEAELIKAFEAFGKISSSTLIEDKKGRKFGFIDYEEHTAAAKAVEDLNEKPNDLCEEGSTLLVTRAQKRSERAEALRRQFAAAESKRQADLSGSNLYVKNLDDSITDDDLKAAFEKFGKITSAKVMLDEAGVSRGFGFVAFASVQEATPALAQMNGQVLGSKPLYVSVAQRREVRKATLEIQHAARGMGGRGMGGAPGMGGQPMYNPYGYPQNAFFNPQFAQYGAMGGRGGMPGMPPQGFKPGQMPYGMMPQGGRGMGPQGGRGGRGGGPMGRGPFPGFNPAAAGVAGKRPPMGPGQGMPPGMPGQGPNFTYTKQARNQGPGMPTPGMPAPGMPVNPNQPAIPGGAGGLEPLTTASLAQMPPEQQKNMLGERLYARINDSHPEHAAKITGMLLEMDISEQLNLLESPQVLASKITEALDVLNRA